MLSSPDHLASLGRISLSEDFALLKEFRPSLHVSKEFVSNWFHCFYSPELSGWPDRRKCQVNMPRVARSFRQKLAFHCLLVLSFAQPDPTDPPALPHCSAKPTSFYHILVHKKRHSNTSRGKKPPLSSPTCSCTKTYRTLALLRWLQEKCLFWEDELTAIFFEAALISEDAGAAVSKLCSSIGCRLHGAETALRRCPRTLTPFPVSGAARDTAADAVSTISSS